MPLHGLIRADAVMPGLRAGTKKAVLQEMAERAGKVSGLLPRDVFDAVLQRERLGSTGVGNGIAIPHGKLVQCDAIFGVFATLDKPVDFDAMDGAPVDLVFLLIAPASAGADHLKALARIARLLRDASVGARLRAIRDAEAQFSLLTALNPTSNVA